MTYLMSLLLVGLVFGLIAVASNPSPYFAALGLVMVAGVSCGVMVSCGGPFLSLVLFLIYLGGMLVVFAYSAALAVEPYPESWGNWSVALYGAFYMGGVIIACFFLHGAWFEYSWMSVDEMSGFSVFRGDMSGVAIMYSWGEWLLITSAWVLLLTLFVVLELTRGLARGALRVV